MLYAELPLSLVRAVAVVFGLLWGSFLNVVIYRLPRGMNVAHPPSHCPACGKPIKPWLNVPVLSYVALRGRASCCGAKMSPRYPIVELLGGGLSLAVVETILNDLPARTTVTSAALFYLACFALALGLLAAAFIDLEHMILPDSITIGGVVLGVASAGLRGMPFAASIAGAAVGFAVIWLPFIFLYKRVRGREGMGLGDAKLLALAGAWFGWIGALVVLFAGAIQGTVLAVAVLATRGKIDEPEAVRADREELKAAAEAGDEEAKAILAEDPLGDAPDEGFGKARLPFGPFLILGIYEMLFCGDLIQEFLGF